MLARDEHTIQKQKVHSAQILAEGLPQITNAKINHTLNLLSSLLPVPLRYSGL
jgi:hypothetical protein